MNVDHVELTDAQAAFVAERIARYAVECVFRANVNRISTGW
jgi:hypothetical protein